jgi:hypothetical protein
VLPLYSFETDRGKTGVRFIEGKSGPWTSVALVPYRNWRPTDISDSIVAENYPLLEHVMPEQATLYPRPYRGIPTWTVLPNKSDTEYEIETFAWGWPARCVRCVERRQPTGTRWGMGVTGQYTVTHQWALKISAASGPQRTPVCPIATGLALNAVIYGAVLWMLTTIAGHLRTAHRLRGGRCAGCGYDRSATSPRSPCPECGLIANVHGTNDRHDAASERMRP